jgi:thymidylate kinase
MIVEFIGSTGAGKTTLIKQILYCCARDGTQAIVGTDFVLQQYRLHGIKRRLMRTVLINVIALLAAVVAWRSNQAFYRFVFRMLLRLPGAVPWFHRLGLAKNILKRIGIYEMIRRHGDEQHLYLVDEGSLHVAHSLFVHLAGAANRHDLSTFASLVPLPQVVVYLRQDEAVLVERIVARGHPRVPTHSLSGAARFVRQAANVFDELVQHPAIEPRVVVVDGAQKVVMTPGSGNNRLLAGVASLVQAGLQVSTERVPE